MGYLHIDNLYRDQSILKLFKRVYALEKIHGTSAHITYTKNPKEGKSQLTFFSGGEKYGNFLACFDQEKLLEAFSLNHDNIESITVYGEAYGGSQQKMSETYGKLTKFIAFDVQFGDTWLNVEQATRFTKKLGLEFVDWVEVDATIEALDGERDRPSVQAVRNGITDPKPREGIVIRPLSELIYANGERVIAKHKGEAFKETATQRKVASPEQQANLDKQLADAKLFAEEYVTPMRLEHVLQKLPEANSPKAIPVVIKAMVEDVFREAVSSEKKSVLEANGDAVAKAINKRTVELFTRKLKESNTGA